MLNSMRGCLSIYAHFKAVPNEVVFLGCGCKEFTVCIMSYNYSMEFKSHARAEVTGSQPSVAATSFVSIAHEEKFCCLAETIATLENNVYEGVHISATESM